MDTNQRENTNLRVYGPQAQQAHIGPCASGARMLVRLFICVTSIPSGNGLRSSVPVVFKDFQADGLGLFRWFMGINLSSPQSKDGKNSPCAAVCHRRQLFGPMPFMQIHTFIYVLFMDPPHHHHVLTPITVRTGGKTCTMFFNVGASMHLT